MESINKDEAIFHLGSMLAAERAARIAAEEQAEQYHREIHDLQGIIAHLRTTEKLTRWRKMMQRLRQGKETS